MGDLIRVEFGDTRIVTVREDEVIIPVVEKVIREVGSQEHVEGLDDFRDVVYNLLQDNANQLPVSVRDGLLADFNELYFSVLDEQKDL